MKKAFLALTVLSIVFVTSCTKTNPTPVIGSWSFGQTTYTASTAVGNSASSTLVASNNSTVNPSTLTLYFSAYPTAAGSYKVVKYGATASVPYVAVGLLNGIAQYYSTGNDNSTVNVTVSSAGKVSATIPYSVELLNTANPTDSALITYITVNQQ